MTIPIFELCRRLLARTADTANAARAESYPVLSDETNNAEAEALLLQLGYWRVDARGNSYILDSQDAEITDHRLAILNLASRMERLFQLPCRQAPGACFVGAEVAPEEFGLDANDSRLMSVAGKGETLRQAFESCVGEAVEHLSFHRWGGEHVFLATINDLFARSADRCAQRHLQWMLDGIGLGDSNPESSIEWLAVRELFGEGELHLPASLCLLDRANSGYQPRRLAESNGCAAGPTLEQACYSALLELIERDAVALWWHGGSPAFGLRLDASGTDRLREIREKIRGSDERRVWFVDLSNDLTIPVVAAFSSDGNGANVACGFAADLDPVVAAQSALLELCQMELALDLVHMKIEQRGESALNSGDKNHLTRASHLSIQRYPRINPPPARLSTIGLGHSHDGCNERLEVCCGLLREAGYKAYWMDLSRQVLGVPAVRVIVPGIQSGKPDWASERLRRARARNCDGDDRQEDLPPLI